VREPIGRDRWAGALKCARQELSTAVVGGSRAKTFGEYRQCQEPGVSSVRRVDVGLSQSMGEREAQATAPTFVIASAAREACCAAAGRHHRPCVHEQVQQLQYNDFNRCPPNTTDMYADTITHPWVAKHFQRSRRRSLCQIASGACHS
jgi:hypothetical protein